MSVVAATAARWPKADGTAATNAALSSNPNGRGLYVEGVTVLKAGTAATLTFMKQDGTTATLIAVDVPSSATLAAAKYYPIRHFFEGGWSVTCTQSDVTWGIQWEMP
jgi:hypothetical protein